ncbi:hypothetical protein PIB30_082261 [Stylosanthes scabra]|uniref:Uncharacterized protein n=1 Tax=Stylosanthes scabra TaxID=79078 RepID=A0ABU6YQ67_9FABA|nr:hypothetical protein [Stylosanthes scabra]
MEGDESFLALVHYDGMIRYKTRENVKFTDKSPTNVFITSRTTLLNLQCSIIRKLGLDGKKRMSMIYYRIPISVVAQGVKYGCFAIEGDDDLQILFHCRRQFLENPIILFWASRAVHLHINPFSAIALGHAVGLVTEGTSSYPER